MIGVSSEVQLLLLAALLYVFDSALLLYVNEGTLTPTGKDWSIKTGGSGFTIRGKNLVFPNLLLPHRPVFRLSWNYKTPTITAPIAWEAERSLYRKLVPMVYGMAILLFLTLPAVLFFNRSDVVLLTCLTMIYMNAALTGIALFNSRKQLELSKDKCWSILLECLLCPPLNINVIRKISTQRVLPGSLVAAGVSLLRKEEWDRLRDELLDQIDNEIEYVNDQEKLALTAARSSIQSIEK
ncbi:MAG: hypothetical protein ACK5D0_12490 [Burkholderiaceae bacterium]